MIEAKWKTVYAGGAHDIGEADIEDLENRINGKIIIKSSTIPTASAEELGKVRMFTGETDAVYTHGYIYECVEDNNVYSWNRVDVQPVTDLTSLENRVTAIEDVVPAQATAQNQLADKAFVNSSIATKQDTISDLATIRSGAAAGATAVQPAALSAYQTTSNLVTSISSSSTNTQYPSAKCVYDIVGNIETLLQGV